MTETGDGLWIDGVTVHTNEHFSAPLMSHVIGNLWIGGCIHGVRLSDDFETVISLYDQEQYTLGPDTRRYDFEMLDSLNEPDSKLIHSAAELAFDKGMLGKTLIHCQAGLNRSALITALTLVKAGWHVEGAIAYLRAIRSPVVLCNKTFEQWLLNAERQDA